MLQIKQKLPLTLKYFSQNGYPSIALGLCKWLVCHINWNSVQVSVTYLHVYTCMKDGLL